MKVLHVIPSVGPLRGGPSVAVRSMANGLTKRGIETHVATTDDNASSRLAVPLGRAVKEDGIVYWYFPRQTAFYLCSLPFTAWMWRHAADYQLIHIHSVFSYCSNVAAWIARRKGVPYMIRPLGVLNRWGISNRRPLLKRLSFGVVERPLLRGAAGVHYTAEQERLEAGELNFSHQPIIIPNPVEMPGFSRQDLHGQFRAQHPELKGRKIALFLSRIDRKKGLDLLLPAFKEVLKKSPDTALVIAGQGDSALIGELRRQSVELGINQAVVWPGFLSGAKKFAAMADADLFVLPSYSENFGIAVVEAMAMGLPIIITDQVGIHQEVAAHHAGLVVTTAVEPLKHAILQLLSDAPLRQTLGRNGAALAHSHFSANTVMTKLINAYNRLLNVTEAEATLASTAATGAHL